jgi:hypothetical protein
MQKFRKIRILAAAIATALVLHSAPAEAATKPLKKGVTTKKSGKRTQSKAPSTRIAANASGKRSTVAQTVKHMPVTRTTTRVYAKTPPRKIDIAKIEPAESLYRKPEAEKPASRILSIFGSRGSSYHYDSRMMRAAEIASARAYGRSHGTCWRFVKNALLDAGVVESRPTTGYAKEAGWELTNNFGFKKIACMDPVKAPVGSVIVYDGRGGRGAGHVEIRTKTGYVSDFFTPNPCRYPVIGIYVKP